MDELTVSTDLFLKLRGHLSKQGYFVARLDAMDLYDKEIASFDIGLWLHLKQFQYTRNQQILFSQKRHGQ